MKGIPNRQKLSVKAGENIQKHLSRQKGLQRLQTGTRKGKWAQIRQQRGH